MSVTEGHLFKQLGEEQAAQALLSQFASVPVRERPELISKWLLAVGAIHKDDEALRYYAWLIYAVRDHANGVDEAHRLAVVAVDLYDKLPACRKSRECVDRDSGEMETIERDTLPKLKLQLLTDIAIGWLKAAQDDQSDRLSDTLVRIAKSNDRHTRERLEKALREATKDGGRLWSRERVIRLLVRFVREVKNDDLARVLLIAVSRTFRCEDLAHLLPVLEALPLDALTPRHQQLGAVGMLAALGREAAKDREMHDAMAHLYATLVRKMPDMTRGFDPAYPEPGVVELAVGIIPRFFGNDQEENAFHDLFLVLQGHIRAWIAARVEEGLAVPSIRLRTYQPTYLSGQRFTRTDTFS